MANTPAFFRQDVTEGRRWRATFRTIYPGWYQGRATHIHVQVLVNSVLIKTTQIAFPEDVSAARQRLRRPHAV